MPEVAGANTSARKAGAIDLGYAQILGAGIGGRQRKQQGGDQNDDTHLCKAPLSVSATLTQPPAGSIAIRWRSNRTDMRRDGRERVPGNRRPWPP